MKIGTRFTRSTSMPYTVDGITRQHNETHLCEVSELEPGVLKWVVVEILSEENRPTAFDAGIPSGGTISAFGWSNAVARGEIALAP